MSSDMLHPAAAPGAGGQVLIAYSGYTTTVNSKTYNARRAWGVFYTNNEPLPEPGWHRMADVPAIYKRVKQGAGLTALDNNVYAMIGNGTREFYRYNVEGCSWRRLSDIPVGPRARGVKKGACITNDGFSVYLAKGNGTQEFYRYDPATDSWTTLPEPGFVKRMKGGYMAFDGERRIHFSAGAGNREWKVFDIFDEAWSAPVPESLPTGKWKLGSFLVSTGDRLFGLRVGGKTNEFYGLGLIPPDTAWTRLADMPLYNRALRKKKAKEGAGGAYDGVGLYALKGGNTLDFYSYDITGDSWQQLEDVGMPEGIPAKRIKSGGALCSSPIAGGLFALIGNKTNEFWFYVPGAAGTDGGAQAAVQRIRRDLTFTLHPNPARSRTAIILARGLNGPAVGRVFDAAGRRVFEAAIERGSLELPADRLNPGVYVVRVIARDRVSDQKLVITE